MHLTVYEQGEIFYFAFVFGAALGLWYDFFRLLRHIGFNSRRAFIIQDIIFMTSCGILCFIFAVLTVNGHLRLFVLTGHTAGFAAYRFSFGMLSGIVFKQTEKTIRILRKAYVRYGGIIIGKLQSYKLKLSEFRFNKHLYLSQKEK